MRLFAESARDGLNKSVGCSSPHRHLSRADGLFRVSLEALHVASRGTVRVSETSNLCAAAMAEAGRLGIFTPMCFIHARKPA